MDGESPDEGQQSEARQGAEPLTDVVAAGTPEPTAAPLALYRRYRPDTFTEVIGQEHVTDPLQRALVNNRVNHAYLFSGPRGCGKTTSARILARSLNCEQGPVAVPCGVCRSCLDLARGGPGSIDVIEIDAASHGGVEDARDLRERAFYAPVSSRYKVYIVDEAHMVTTAGFNALLKLVEEPPPHVKFVFATTEPEKVIGTIRSRTHHYPFRLVPPRVLGSYLSELCEAEGIAVEPAVLPLVVRAGGGSVRDSLSVLDQLLGGATEDGVSYQHAAALLGYTPDSLLDEMVDAFAAGDAAGVFAAVDKIIEVGQDPRRFAEDLLRRLRDLVIVDAVPDAVSQGLVEASEDQAGRLQTQAAGMGSGELARAAEVVAAGLTEMRGTTAPRLYLELMCARVLLPGADVDGRGLHARLERLERRVGMDGPARPSRDTAPTARSDDRPAPQDGPPPATEDVLATPAGAGTSEPHAGEHGQDDQSQADPEAVAGGSPVGAVAQGPARQQSRGEQSARAAEEGAGERSAQEPGAGAPQGAAPQESIGPSAHPGKPGSTPSPSEQDGPAGTGSAGGDPVAAGQPGAAQSDASGGGTPVQTTEPAAGGLDVTDLRRLWPEVLEEVKRQRRFTWVLISQNSHVMGVDGDVLTLGLSNAGARDSFARGGNEDVLRAALVQVLGADLRVQAIVDDGTPAAPESRGRPGRPTGRPGSGVAESSPRAGRPGAAAASGASTGSSPEAPGRDAAGDQGEPAGWGGATTSAGTPRDPGPAGQTPAAGQTGPEGDDVPPESGPVGAGRAESGGSPPEGDGSGPGGAGGTDAGRASGGPGARLQPGVDQDGPPLDEPPAEEPPPDDADYGGGPAPEEVSGASRARSDVRASIRPTRSRRPGAEGTSGQGGDEHARRDDTDLDESAASHNDLLALHLGAELIAEEGEER